MNFMFCFVIAFPFGQRPKGSDTTFCQDDKNFSFVSKTMDFSPLVVYFYCEDTIIKRLSQTRWSIFGENIAVYPRLLILLLG